MSTSTRTSPRHMANSDVSMPCNCKGLSFENTTTWITVRASGKARP
jgi:hypothetical protein